MKTFFLLFSFLIIFIACSKKKNADCPTTEYSYSYKVNAKVDTLRNPKSLVAAPGTGNKLVFIYNKNYITCPEISDGDVTEILLFEADPSTGSFEYNSSSMQDNMVYFRRICFCEEKGSVIPVSGTIKGIKLNASSWKIDFDIVISNNDRIQNSGVFILQ